MQMNLRICLLFVLVTINILMHAVIADHQESESLKSRTPRQNNNINLPELCYLDPERGPCNICDYDGCYVTLQQRYWYNKDKDQCGIFNYGGCRGNANNFRTREDCEATCPSRGNRNVTFDI